MVIFTCLEARALEIIYSMIEQATSSLKEVRVMARAMEEVSSFKVDAVHTVEFSSYRL